MSSARRWLAFGSGAGIHIAGPRGAESLQVAAVRIPPGGAAAARMLRGVLSIPDFQERPAGAWGTDYAAFLRKWGMPHVAATVMLPRHDLVVRPLSLPGVSDKDVDGAIGFQMDGLHPYSEESVYSSWARLPGTATVLVAIARREAIDRYAALFAEAGIKIGAFTCPAAAIYSALRLFGGKPASALLAVDESSAPLEVYGESASRPVFSAGFDLAPERAAALAAAELRIDPETPATPLSALLGTGPALAYAAALASASPGLSLKLNLLPAEKRQSSSRLRWVPVGIAGALVLLTAGALAGFPGYENHRYQRTLSAQIAAIAPLANRADQDEKQIAADRARIQLLDDLRRRPRQDMDALAELTRVLAPPTWINFLDISAHQVIAGGETNQAEPLLKLLDASPLFEASEFQGAPVPTRTGQSFRIKTNREGMR